MIKAWKIIGLMSGTSLDGLDIALCKFWKENEIWQSEIQKTQTVSYSEKWKSRLSISKELSGYDLTLLDVELGKWMGQQVKAFCEFISEKPDFIASHGHTVFHQPELGLTLQIGSACHLSTEAELPVISDFRRLDVAKGGQGAPLVPIGDQMLFADYDFCLNLGGIANVSANFEGSRIAFDLAPCNMGFNYACSWLDKSFDEGGKIAKSGTTIEHLLCTLNALPFYALKFPKSLGSEWFEREIVPLLIKYKDSPENVLCTLVHHSAYQIAQGLLKIKQSESSILVTGGGAHNQFLIDTLQSFLGNKFSIVIPSVELIDFKEALVFAFLGLLGAENQINTLASVTGAKSDSCSGQICGRLQF